MRKYWSAAAAGLLAASSAALADGAPTSGSDTITTSIVVEPDGRYVETVHTERFAANDAAAMSAARISIPYNAQLQDLAIVEAYTLKPDGMRIPLDPASIQEQMQRDAGPFSPYGDRRTKVLEFPQFLTGDTIVYTVRLTTQPYFPGHFTHSDIYPPAAIARSETTTISVPKNMVLKTDLRDVEMTSREEGSRRLYTLRYIPKKTGKPDTAALLSLISSAASGSLLNAVPHYVVSSFADYGELGRAEAALIEPKVVADEKVKALAARILGGETNRHEQARKLYEWVAKNIRYVAVELGRGGLEPHDVDWVISNGYGDCKDHDLLLRALLKASGIDSQSVLLNGTNAYTLNPAPGLTELSHIITYIPEFDLYLDSSNARAPFGVVSTALYGKPAIRISARGATQVTLPPAPVSTVQTDVIETLGSDGVIKGTYKNVVSGPASLTARGTSLRLQTDSSDSAVSSRLSGRSLKDPKGTAQNDPPTDLAPSHSVTVTFTSPGWVEWLSGMVTKPMPGAAASLGGETAAGFSSFSSKGDEPVTCSPVRASEHVALTLPESYAKTPHLPEDTKVDTSNLSFAAHWSYSAHVLTLDRTLITKFPEARCSAAVKNDTNGGLTRVNASYGAAISLNPDTAPQTSGEGDAAVFKAASEAYKKGDFATTARLLSELLDHTLTDQHAYAARIERGNAYLRLGKLNAAIDDLSIAIRLRPEGAIAVYEMRARAYQRTGRTKEALADLDVAIQRSPEDVMLREFHADVATAAGAYASAVKDYDVILKYKPNSQQTLLMRATAHLGAGQYDDAAGDYEAAGKQSASDGVVLNGLCDALARSSRLGEAQYQCSRALEIHPLAGAQLESRGLIRFRQGKYALALEDFAKAAEIYPQNARYLCERGLAKEKLGEKESGQRDIARAAKIDPDVLQKVPEKMRP